MVFHELFYLFPSFKLPFFDKIQFYFPVFCKLLLNLYKSIVLILRNLDFFITFHASSSFYYILAETETIDNIIMAVLSAFEKKPSEIKNNYLRHYVQIFAKDLDLHVKTYLKKYKLISNALTTKFYELAHIISNYFNNLALAS